MGLLTTEHGKAAYFADFVVYAVASTGLAVLLAIVAPYPRRTELLAYALLGLVAWTLLEYALHRFVLHGMQPFRAWHAEHHRRPRALIGTPTILSTVLIAALVFLPALVLSDIWRASALTFGLLTGYLVYALVHHATHHWRADNAWLRQLKRHHALHHALHNAPVATAARYGVTSAFWDFVFRTDGKSVGALRRVAKPARESRRDTERVSDWENQGGAAASHADVGPHIASNPHATS